MNKYGMIVFLVAFAGQVGCFGDESSWVIENYEALKAKDFKTHIVLSIFLETRRSSSFHIDCLRQIYQNRR